MHYCVCLKIFVLVTNKNLCLMELKYLGFKMYEKTGDLNKQETYINMKDIIMPFFQTSEIISKD
jgi:hypothetical protein